MDKYSIYISPQACREIDDIYGYIINELKNPQAAEETAALIENAIISLDMLPHRGAERKVGIYAYQGYRQLFVKNYTIIYRIEEDTRSVIIITVRYSHGEF